MQENAPRDESRTVRVAAVQMASENGCIAANLAHATPFVEQASKEGAQLVLLPEFMPTGYLLADGIWEAAEPAQGATVTWLKDTSKRLGMHMGTSFLEAECEDFFNTFVLANPKGEVAGRVRKQHPAVWEAYFFRGESGCHAIESTFGKVGVGICFDSQTADVATIMGRQSVDLMLMPHSYPVGSGSSGVFSKERMVRSLQKIAPLYASLFGVPVVLANKCGPWQSTIPGAKLVDVAGSFFPGQSVIVDSDGIIRAQLEDEEGLIVADVTLDPTRKKKTVPPHYGRYLQPGPKRRVLLRLVEGIGRLHYGFSSTRKSKARSMSQQG